MSNRVYEIITNRIIEQLEKGVVPWHKPWRGDCCPRNINGRAYRGINTFLLGAFDFSSPYWLTFNQVSQRGGKLKKGSKGMPIVFWKLLESKRDEEDKVIPLLRYYTVFNLDQAEGIKAPLIEERKFNPIESCEEVIAGMPSIPEIRHGKAQAYYNPAQDYINMPKKEVFESDEAYYSALFHELNHSTGHISRLNRKLATVVNPFGSDDYSREELIAEMGSAFLCAHCNIENKVINNSAAYIQSWLSQFRNDKRLIVISGAMAQKSADYILNIDHEAESEKDE